MQLLLSLLGTRLVNGFSSSTPCTNYHLGTAGSTGETICPMLRSRIVDYLTVQMRQANEREMRLQNDPSFLCRGQGVT